jgi:phospholipase/carboxylesterase
MNATNLQEYHPVWQPSARPGAPVMILFHGTGGNELQMVEFARRVLDGRPANLLGLRGQELEGGYVTRWFRRLSEGVFDTESVIERAGDLAKVIRLAGREYGFDPGDALALGYSNGANIAAALMLLHPESIRGAAMIRTMLPLNPDSTPDLHGKHALLLSGKHDPYGPLQSAKELAAQLENAQAEVEHPVLSAGHEIVEQDLMIIRSWFDRVLSSVES